MSPTTTYVVAPAIVGDLTFTKNNPEEDEGTTATCEWSGDPKPLITWLKDGEILNEAELGSHIRIVTRDLDNGNQLSELQIQSVEPGDAGEYTCNVSNPVGFKFKMRRLEVQGMAIHACIHVCVCLCMHVHVLYH